MFFNGICTNTSAGLTDCPCTNSICSNIATTPGGRFSDLTTIKVYLTNAGSGGTLNSAFFFITLQLYWDQSIYLLSDITNYSERQMLLQISEGDEKAFATLVKMYSGLLFTYLVKLTKDQDIASDVVQEIFTQLWLTRESLKGVESFRSWLFVISRHHALRMLKNIDREHKKREEWYQFTQTDPGETVAQDDASLKEAYDSMVKNAIDRLPPQQKKAWILARIEGKKYAEIAQEMQISRETVKKYLQIASLSIVDYIRNNGLPLIIGFLIMKL